MGGKGRVVWLWKEYETATDERIIKSVIAALDSTWVDESSVGSGCDDEGSQGKQSKISNLFNKKKKCNEMSSTTTTESADDDKRKKAATAAESRMSGIYHHQKQIEDVVEKSHGDEIKKQQPMLLKHTEKKGEVEIIDLVDSD